MTAYKAIESGAEEWLNNIYIKINNSHYNKFYRTYLSLGCKKGRARSG
jgi:hypothetical protein